MQERVAERERMVAEQIEARGVRDPAVLAAMRAVPRHAFVPAHLAELAYSDRALPVDEDQTISQPYIVALMAEALALRPTSRVLEIGAGTGYAAAVMARLAAEVVTIEIRPALAERAATRLAALGVHNVRVEHGDGSLGWGAGAPWDAIAVAASGPRVPPALLEELAEGGRLVLPLGPVAGVQQLVRFTRHGDHYDRDRLGGVQFVPLVHLN